MLFDKFAESNWFDPLLPDNWYKITRSKISSMKVYSLSIIFFFFLLFCTITLVGFLLISFILQGSEMIMSMYGTSLSQTLVQSYPDVDLNLTKFKFVQKRM